jgi:hypothetical protein
MIPATEDFDIRAARECDLNPNQDVSATDSRNGYRLYLQMFFAVKHSGHHVIIH